MDGLIMENPIKVNALIQKIGLSSPFCIHIKDPLSLIYNDPIGDDMVDTHKTPSPIPLQPGP